MTFPEEELPDVAEAAHEVVQEAKEAGVWVCTKSRARTARRFAAGGREWTRVEYSTDSRRNADFGEVELEWGSVGDSDVQVVGGDHHGVDQLVDDDAAFLVGGGGPDLVEVEGAEE